MFTYYPLFLQHASKDQVDGLLEKARASVPAKPAAPAKAAAATSNSVKPAAAATAPSGQPPQHGSKLIGSSSSANRGRHVSTVAQNRQTKHWL